MWATTSEAFWLMELTLALILDSNSINFPVSKTQYKISLMLHLRLAIGI